MTNLWKQISFPISGKLRPEFQEALKRAAEQQRVILRAQLDGRDSLNPEEREIYDTWENRKVEDSKYCPTCGKPLEDEMTESGFPSSGIPLKDLAICSDCDLAFFASDGVCPKCASSIGWMLLPTKFTKQPEKKDDQKD